MVIPTQEAEALIEDAALLGVTLTDREATVLLTVVAELQRWNRAYNLTAVDERAAIITHHLLDSLSAAPFLVGERIADVGTGAGFPGLPLALVFPDKQFTLIDSNGKKISFVKHARRTLGLMNVFPVQTRAEDLVPEEPFDCVIARAYAPLPDLLKSVEGLCKPSTRVVAMKGREPLDEIAALPANWQLVDLQRVEVPGLEAERHLLTLVQASRPEPAAPDAGASPAA